MLQLYQLEKKKVIESAQARKSFYIGEVQTRMRSKYTYDWDGNPKLRYPNPEDDPIKDRENWDGETAWFDHLQSALNALDKKYEKWLPKPQLKGSFLWIGINPPKEDYTMKTLYEALDELKLKDYIASVEGYVEEGGYRPHIHMIYTGDVRKNRIIEKLMNHFNCKNNFINYETLKKSKYLEQKTNYIEGKKSCLKMSYVLQDRAERLEKNIPDIIEK